MKYRGLPILIGVLLIVVSLVIHLVWPGSWLAESELFLHLGAIVALLGYLIGDVFGPSA
jgi:hypothetical protein